MPTVKHARIHAIERNKHGAWVIYGSEGVKQYYGYTKERAQELYKGSGRDIVNIEHNSGEADNRSAVK